MPVPKAFDDSLAEESVSLWLVEDNDTYRSSLSALVDQTQGLRCIRSFRSCEEALKALEEEFAPEVILIDIGLPGMDGIEGLRLIKAISPSTRMIMLTVYDDDEAIFKAISAGASGYLVKSAQPGEIVCAIREVLRGGAPLSAGIARKVLDMFSRLGSAKGGYGLTLREKEILGLIVEGLTMKQVAARLFLSPYTIDTHIKNIYAKLQVHSRSGVVAKAIKEHLL